jgi:hypothetical protein
MVTYYDMPDVTIPSFNEATNAATYLPSMKQSMKQLTFLQ